MIHYKNQDSTKSRMIAELAIWLDWFLIWVFTRFQWFCKWNWVWWWWWWWCDKRLRFRNFGASHLFSNFGLLQSFAGYGGAQTLLIHFPKKVCWKSGSLSKTSGHLSPDRLLPGKVTVLFHKSVAGWRIPASLCTKPQLSFNFHWDSICCGFARQAPQFLKILTKFHCSELSCSRLLLMRTWGEIARVPRYVPGALPTKGRLWPSPNTITMADVSANQVNVFCR